MAKKAISTGTSALAKRARGADTRQYANGAHIRMQWPETECHGRKPRGRPEGLSTAAR